MPPAATQPPVVDPPHDGAVTLVFTRLDDADGLWRRMGPALRPLLAAHDQILRAALGAQGYEVKRDATGFLFSFQDAAAALRAAAAAADRLESHPWASLLPAPLDDSEVPLNLRVGFGMHTGSVVLRPDAASGRVDYLGPTVNQALRVAETAAGDQILFTQDTLTEASASGYAVENPEDEGAWITLRGGYNLKGVPSTVMIFELRPHRLRAIPLLPLATHPRNTASGTLANLPPVEGALLGRDDLLMSLANGADLGQRWTTLTGPPGVGKSRLAVEFARWSQTGVEGRAFGGGVWWVDLAGARDPTELLLAVARSVTVSIHGRDAETQLIGALATRGELLLVMDEAELILGPLINFVRRLLNSAPRISVLVTSRIATGDPREQVIEVTALPTPLAGASPEALARNPAILLVMDRLKRHPEGRKVLNPEYLPALGALVRRLDGLPLALTLAIAAPKEVSALDILDAVVVWVEAGLVELAPTPEAGDALRASMARSWSLLPPWAQGALAQLSVFRGGFTLEAAEAVLDLTAWPEAPVMLDVVELLVRHHLVSRSPDSATAGPPRYHLSPFSLAFALDRLAAAVTARGSARDLAEARHGRWFALLGSARMRLLARRLGGAQVGATLLAEQENLRAAWRRAGRRGDPDTERGCAAALLALSMRQGPLDAVIEIVLPLLAAPHPPEKVAWLAADGARVLALSGRVTDAHRVITTAMAFLGQGGSDALRARLLADIATILRERSANPKAGEFLERAMGLARTAGDNETLGLVLTRHAAMMSFDGKPAASMVALEEALRIARAADDLQLEALVLRTQGDALLSLGRPAEALLALQRTADLYTDLGQTRLAAIARLATVKPLNLVGRHEEAEALATALIPALQAMGDDGNLARAYDALGTVLAARGRLEEGRRALEEALRYFRRTQSALGLAGTLTNLAAVFLLLGRPQEARPLYAEAAPLLEGLGSLTGEGTCRAGHGEALAACGKLPEALAEFGRAEELLRRSQDRAALVGVLVSRGLMRAQIKRPEAKTDLAEAEALLDTLQIQLNPATRAALDTLRGAVKARGFGSGGRRLPLGRV